jgi:hypothetical protein
LGNVTAAADSKGVARLDTFGLPQPYSGTLTVHGQQADSTLTRGDFIGGDLYSYGAIDRIEKLSYANRADSGGRLD